MTKKFITERNPWLRAGEAEVVEVFCQITKVWILGASIDDDICCGKQTDRKTGSSVISAVCVSAGPARRRFAYPPATAHMFGKRNSWTWPRAKMGQTDTDGEKTPTGSLSDDKHSVKTSDLI